MKSFLTLASLVAGSVAWAQDVGLPEMDAIRRSWAERERLYTHLRVSWKETSVYPAGSMPLDPFFLDMAKRSGEPIPKGPIPPKDLVLELGGEMKFSNRKVWYVRTRPLWSGPNHAIYTDYATWDGETGRRFTPKTDGGAEKSHGTIRQNAADVEMFDNLFIPIWALARGSGKLVRVFDLDKYRVARKEKRADGKQLVVLSNLDPLDSEQRLSMEIWVDANQPHLPYRVSRLIVGRPEYAIDIEYQPPRMDGLALPSSWRESEFSAVAPKEIGRTRTVEVIKWEPADKPISDTELSIHFSEGTYIRDDSKGTPTKFSYVGKGEQLIEIPREVLKGGPDSIARFVQQEESSSYWWLHTTIAGAGLLVLVILIARLRRQRR